MILKSVTHNSNINRVSFSIIFFFFFFLVLLLTALGEFE